MAGLRPVNVQKRYVENNETKDMSSFSLAELPRAIRALQLASEWVEQQEASIEPDG